MGRWMIADSQIAKSCSSFPIALLILCLMNLIVFIIFFFDWLSYYNLLRCGFYQKQVINRGEQGRFPSSLLYFLVDGRIVLQIVRSAQEECRYFVKEWWCYGIFFF